MSIQIISYADGAAFAATAAAWIARDPAGMALVASVAALPGAWSMLITVDGIPVVAATQTSPRMMIVEAASSPEPATVAALAEHARYRDAPGIIVPVAWAEAVITAMARPVRVRERQRLHRLVGRPQLPRPTAGAARWATSDDVERLRCWRDGFNREALSNETTLPTSAEQILDVLNNLLLWTVEGVPVAMAVRARPVLGGWSIGWVYTPPDQRRRGYAGALVHALANRLQADGATYVSLYTDLANPTSNRLYADIGFVPVADSERIFWSTT